MGGFFLAGDWVVSGGLRALAVVGCVGVMGGFSVPGIAGGVFEVDTVFAEFHGLLKLVRWVCWVNWSRQKVMRSEMALRW
jgi:hypothetical protein